MRKFAFTIFLVITGSVTANAQTDFNYSEIKKKHPEDDSYVLKDKTSIVIELKNGKMGITSYSESNTLLLSDKAVTFSPHSIYYYDEKEDIYDITAASYVPNEKNKFKKTLVKEIFVQKPLKDNIFYDDFKEIHFRYPGLTNGSVTSLSYTTKLKDPYVINPFYFITREPIRDAEFSVKFPKEVKLKYLLVGETAGIKFSKEEDSKSITMTWVASNLDGYHESFDSYNSRKTFPHLIVYIDRYESDGETVKVLSNNAELHRWFSTHIHQLLIEPEKQVKDLSDSIVAGAKSDEEKIKRIYYWVQENIKYIAFEQGLGGYVPRPAALVCSRRYGDCKDKSSLLYALLKAAGIKAYFTWVGTRDIPYSFSELSSPFVCNHMIVSLRNGDSWTFLDGTSDHLPYGYPSYPVQGKEAMISIAPDSFVVTKIPVVAKERNLQTDSVYFSIDKNSITGTGSSFFTGLMKHRVDNEYFDVTSQDRDEELKRMFEFGSNKCKTEISGYSGNNSFEDSLFIQYKFVIPDYVSAIGKKLIVNMNLVKDLQGEDVDTSVKSSDRNYYFTSLHNKSYTLNIPKNYAVSIVPADSVFKGDGFGYSVHYKSFPDKIILEKSYWIDAINFPKSSFASWNNMIAGLNEVYSGVVVLQEK